MFPTCATMLLCSKELCLVNEYNSNNSQWEDAVLLGDEVMDIPLVPYNYGKVGKKFL